jgi:ribosomal protein S1
MIDEVEVTEGYRSSDSLPFDAGTLRHVLDLAIENADGGDGTPRRAAAWRELERTHREREAVRGQILLTVDAGVFVQLGPGVYGFVPRVELPSWVPRQPRAEQLGRELEGIVIGLDAEAGLALLSPRLLALRRVQAARAADERLEGTVISATGTGVVVDLDGARGVAPLDELAPEGLLSQLEPGDAWHGYAIGMTDTGPLLSHFTASARAQRARAREQILCEFMPGAIRTGLVVRAAAEGVLVAFEGGLVWGSVPRAALRSPAGRRLARGCSASFRVLASDSSSAGDLELWPSARPSGAQRADIG